VNNSLIENASFKDVMMCPVHGAIDVYDHELKAINHALFQRLRDVMQNDILHYIFMGATHNRFAHSIGTMHIAGRVFASIIKNKKNKRSKEVTGKLHLTRPQEQAVIYLTQVLRLSTLLHDTGHGAFSHLLEKTKCIESILNAPETPSKLWKGIDTSSFYQKLPTQLAHEHYSVRAAYQILHDAEVKKSGIVLSDVLNAMETTDGKPSEKFVKSACDIWPVIAAETDLEPHEKAAKVLSVLESILSNEFDADKADYLLRDSQYAGVNYGKFDLDTITNNFSIDWLDDEQWLGLTINKKGVGALENFVFSRYSMYLHVYNHKATNGFELILSTAIEEIMEKPHVYETIYKSLTDINEFANFSDGFMWQEFKTLAREKQNSYSSKLIKRERITFIGNFSILEDSNIEGIINDIAEEYSLKKEKIRYRVLKTKFSKISKSYDKIRVVDKHPINNTETIRNITEVSSFFDKFSDQKSVVVHYNV